MQDCLEEYINNLYAYSDLKVIIARAKEQTGSIASTGTGTGTCTSIMLSRLLSTTLIL